MNLHVNLSANPYDIIIEKGVLDRACEELNLDRKVLIVTDSGVPYIYAEKLAAQCKFSVIKVVPMGEESKNLEMFSVLSKILLDNGFSRKDCVVAVGGGVVGDLSGFVAASFMRGIDFYNIPTTVLSQVDSSIGGKTAVNFCGVKNIIGAFYQPKKVLIDENVLSTLSKRLIADGLCEALKMSVTCDKELFETFENGIDFNDLTPVIARAVDIKRRVVEADEKEQSLRKVLNFGHTIGHGIEVSSDGKLLHGECVGLGMLMMCDPSVKSRIKNVMTTLSLPVSWDIDEENAIKAIAHDKKSNGDTISTVYVKEIGSFEFKNMTVFELSNRIRSFKEENV